MKVIFALLIFTTSLFAQSEKFFCSSKDRIKIREYSNKLSVRDDFISDCESETSSNSKRIRIAGFMPSAINLVRPNYPKTAIEYNIFGSVDIETITDEEGYVIYAKAVDGKKVFWNSAEKAACASRFTLVIFCGRKVMQKKLIRYNFLLN